MKKHFFLASTLSTLVITSLMSFSLSTQLDNTFSNGGFESGDAPWNQWWGLEIDKTEKHSGEASCRIVAQSNAWRGTGQMIPCPEGAKSIKISGWIKTKEIVPNGEGWNNAKITATFMKTTDSKDPENYVGEKYLPSVGEFQGTNDWKEVTKTYSIPAGCKYIQIGVMCGQATGTAWFDDLKVTIE